MVEGGFCRFEIQFRHIIFDDDDVIIARRETRVRFLIKGLQSPFYFITNNGLAHLFVDGKTHPGMGQAVLLDVKSKISVSERFSLPIYSFKIPVFRKKVLFFHGLCGKSFSSLKSAGAQNLTTAARSHARTKTVFSFSLFAFRLERSFHDYTSSMG